jgi:3-methyladenine DNA glycosylase AlkD
MNSIKPGINNLIKQLRSASDGEIARQSAKFFKTGKGEYGEGDKFLGIRVPTLRKIAKEHTNIDLSEVTQLLASPFHESRLLALFILIERYKKASENEKKLIANLYLCNTKCINSWDLVDSSAHKILGDYLEYKDKSPLYKLVCSNNLWERRIAIIATLKFIVKGQFDDTIRLSELLLKDNEDLIHKAVGWMLREVGKRDLERELDFLNRHSKGMPRTMLRYAIERFPQKMKCEYL